MVAFDWVTGEIMDMLDEHGIADNTIVIFSSDNGPVYDDGYRDGTIVHTSSKEVDQGHDGSGPYRGGKYQIYEGGTRVPFIVRWPAKIKPGKSAAMMNQIDFVSTFAALLDVQVGRDEAIDSRNMLPALLGESDEGLPWMIEEAAVLALRKGKWKYIQGKKGNRRAPVKPQLFDLEADIGEQNDLSKKHPELMQEMEGFLNKLVEGRVRID